MTENVRIAYFGAGCFWNSELIYSKQNGVIETEVGWASIEGEGRVEVVKVEFDPRETTYDKLIDVFWTTHDASSEKHEDKYYVERSVLFTIDEVQNSKAQNRIKEAKISTPKVKTEVVPFTSYTRAPEKDQKYYVGK